MSYRVKLNVFEGPFDLLVYLIEHAEMSIYDIQISEIVKQYMEHVKAMQITDVNVSSEFMVLAAALLEIKSKMLLPVETVEAEETGEDPRLELVNRLLEYKTYKYIAHTLSVQDDSYLEGWQKLANEIHKYDSKVVAQLLHPAYMAIPFPETPQLVGPSEVGPYYAKTPPRPLTKEEISIIVNNLVMVPYG